VSKGPLRTPLASLFEQQLPAQAMDRLWLRVRRAEAARPRRRATLWLTSATAACVLLALSAYFWSRPSSLLLANRDALPARLSSQQPRTLPLADGSQVELGPEALLDVLQNNEHLFVVALRTGRARFSVVPGGPRAWRVECGPVSVDVVGTIFSVERSSSAVRVQVERGRVLVSGEGVPDRVTQLSAGKSILVPIASPLGPPIGGGVIGSAASPPTAPLPVPAPAASAATGTPPAVRTPAQQDSAAGIRMHSWSEPPPAGSAAPDAVDALLRQADAAAREGAPARAVSLLQRALAEHPRDVRAPLAQFTLGRLYLDSLGDPAKAVVFFTRAIQSGIPGPLAEDAHARLVQAFARAGNRDGAARAAARYLARYPTGAHLQAVNRWATDTAGR
jgi:transmembrane sensor